MNPSKELVSIRPAEPADVPDILRLVHALAEYEREPDAVEATEEDFHAALFPDGRSPTSFAHVAELDGRVVAIAIWYLTFSTWTGRNGIWLEDLFVEPAARGHGLGGRLIAELARVCAERDYRRLEWWVLKWNEPALGFYGKLGAVAQDEWEIHRLDGEALRNAATCH